jgi:hypothetical protein
MSEDPAITAWAPAIISSLESRPRGAGMYDISSDTGASVAIMRKVLDWLISQGRAEVVYDSPAALFAGQACWRLTKLRSTVYWYHRGKEEGCQTVYARSAASTRCLRLSGSCSGAMRASRNC